MFYFSADNLNKYLFILVVFDLHIRNDEKIYQFVPVSIYPSFLHLIQANNSY